MGPASQVVCMHITNHACVSSEGPLAAGSEWTKVGRQDSGRHGGSRLLKPRKVHLFFLIKKKFSYFYFIGLPRWFSGKESACNAGDSGSIPRLVRSPGGGNGNTLQYSRLENPMERVAWWVTCGRKRVGHNRATKPPRQY